MAGLAQLVRALVCGTRGRGFKPHISPQELFTSDILKCMKKAFIIAIFSCIAFLVLRYYFGYPSELLVDYSACPNDSSANCAPMSTLWGRIEPLLEMSLLAITFIAAVIGIVKLIKIKR